MCRQRGKGAAGEEQIRAMQTLPWSRGGFLSAECSPPLVLCVKNKIYIYV